MDSFRLDGRVALVTGAGSGLGLAFAEALAEAGADVACLDVSPDGAAHAAARVGERGRRAIGVVADVRREDEVVAAFRRTEAELGPLTIAFANAGIAGEGGALAETTLAGWQRELDINLTGVYLTMREAARAMEPRGYGKIVSTASIYGLVGDAIEGGFAYAATKGAVVNLTRTAAVRLAPHGIRVNAIAPGYARTRIGDGILLADSPEAEELREEIRRRTPLGHLAEPDDLKGIAVFLASPASDYCTGFTYAVDGGWLAS